METSTTELLVYLGIFAIGLIGFYLLIVLNQSIYNSADRSDMSDLKSRE